MNILSTSECDIVENDMYFKRNQMYEYFRKIVRIVRVSSKCTIYFYDEKPYFNLEKLVSEQMNTENMFIFFYDWMKQSENIVSLKIDEIILKMVPWTNHIHVKKRKHVDETNVVLSYLKKLDPSNQIIPWIAKLMNAPNMNVFSISNMIIYSKSATNELTYILQSLLGEDRIYNMDKSFFINRFIVNNSSLPYNVNILVINDIETVDDLQDVLYHMKHCTTKHFEDVNDFSEKIHIQLKTTYVFILETFSLQKNTIHDVLELYADCSKKIITIENTELTASDTSYVNILNSCDIDFWGYDIMHYTLDSMDEQN